MRRISVALLLTFVSCPNQASHEVPSQHIADYPNLDELCAVLMGPGHIALSTNDSDASTRNVVCVGPDGLMNATANNVPPHDLALDLKIVDRAVVPTPSLADLPDTEAVMALFESCPFASFLVASSRVAHDDMTKGRPRTYVCLQGNMLIGYEAREIIWSLEHQKLLRQ